MFCNARFPMMVFIVDSGKNPFNYLSQSALQDIPDLEGDRQFNIQSFTVQMGQQKVGTSFPYLA
jgi:hypothetical protein